MYFEGVFFLTFVEELNFCIIKNPLKMKNKRTFLASIALGVFLLAMAAPVIDIDNQDLNVDKRKLTKKI